MHYQKLSKWIRSLLLTFLVAISSGTLLAEDIEIFSNELPPAEPNILFLLDQSGSMNTPIGSTGETRLTALQAAFNSVVSDPEIVGLKVGLMGFSNGVDKTPYPHGVSFPVSPIDDEAAPIMLSNLLPAALNNGTNIGYFTLADDNLPDPAAGQTIRDYLPQILSSWTAFGATPIVDAYYEAALYFRGAPPFWGAASPEQNHAAHPSTYTGTIISEVSTTLTGNTQICTEPNCGINCVSTTTPVECPGGVTSCYLGTNCTSGTNDWTENCTLPTKAECLASKSTFKSCEATTSQDCSTDCSGGRNLESGECLGAETQRCTTVSSFTCQASWDYTNCDKEAYQCDETEDVTTTTPSATYASPITNECQNNAIVVLSDGQPFVADDAETDNTRSLVKSMIGMTADCAAVPGQVLPETNENSLADGRCGAELAHFLNTQDQSSVIDKDNTVQTYAIGFDVASSPGAEGFLQSLASSGGGKYFPASNTAALVAAFKSIINDLGVSARSFAAPVYTVDPNSMLSHSDDIYLPLFENSHLPAWSGNIKKFKLNSAGKIVDRNGDEAIDDKGALKSSAVDFWADGTAIRTADTNPITSGGAANNLDPSSRKLLTDVGAALQPLNDSKVTKSDLGDALMSDAYKSQLLSYIQGYKADGVTARSAMGDILHSKPTVISYADKQVLFFGTNEGYLHAINAADSTPSPSVAGSGGMEMFAFMPSSLLSNIDGMLKNTELTGSLKRIYGLDGPITAWIIDKNNNGKVDGGASGDKAYLFFGLRRGGSAYYALDVTDPSNPSLAWKIDNSGSFSALGETWSKPVLAKLRYKNTSGSVVFDNVLVFGGGYDNRLDDDALNGAAPSAVKGNGVYIVNAKTGALIKSFVGGGLTHSVPSDIRVLDVDKNGSIDRLYFGDTGGNIWRADLNVDDFDSDVSLHDMSDAHVRKFASLGGSGADARKFFYEPDVSLFKHKGKNTIVLSIGSGYRSRPLNEVINDRFYVLYDENVFGIPTSAPASLSEADLAESVALAGNDFLPSYKGWYKKLVSGTGEKVLASAVTFRNKVIFTTFANTDVSLGATGDECNALTKNVARAYVLDLMTASAKLDLDGKGTVDESILIERGDILDSPQLVFNKPSNCTKDGCDQHVDIRIGKKLVPIIDKNTKDENDKGSNSNIGDYLPKVFWVNE